MEGFGASDFRECLVRWRTQQAAKSAEITSRLAAADIGAQGDEELARVDGGRRGSDHKNADIQRLRKGLRR
jgi:hypothetical protein